MKKKLVFITSRLPWPIDSGRKMSLSYYCKGLHEIFGYDIYLYSFLEHDQIYDGNHPEYIEKVYIAEPISKINKIINIIKKSIFGKKWPFQCSIFYNKKNFKKINEICKEIKPDVIFTEMIRTAEYYEAFKDIDAIKIANLDDLLSKRYFRQSKIQTTSNAAGNYASNLPSIINKILKNSKIKNMILKKEGKLCEKWEKKFYEMYDYSMFTSPIETNEMNSIMKNNKAKTLSVGVDYDLLSRDIIDLKKEDNSISYIGNFNVAANVDTLDMICNKILPLLKHNYKFYIIGSCPEKIMKEYNKNENIVFVGRVEDLTEYIRKTQVFFCPISFGTGIKTKIVEAMAMGMPIITNDVGAEGIAATNGKELIIENDFNNLAKCLDNLLENCTLREELGKNAQQFAYDNFRWEVVYKSFEDIKL